MDAAELQCEVRLGWDVREGSDLERGSDEKSCCYDDRERRGDGMAFCCLQLAVKLLLP